MDSNAFFPDGTPMEDWFGEAPDYTAEKSYPLNAFGIAPAPSLQTQAIQSLIDRIAEDGGGTLVVPAGRYCTGALFFRPGVHLHLAPGAILQGSDDPSDYPIRETRIEGETCQYLSAMINAEDCDGFRLTGEGILDGNGLRSWKAFWMRRAWNPACTNKDEQRARLLYVAHSDHVTIQGVTLQNAQFWTSHFYRCRYLRILQCRFCSPHAPVKAPSTDAIDLDACKDVVIRGCFMDVNDDAIALKGGKGPAADTLSENGSNERILIENCHYGFCHGCLTLGSEAIHCRNVILRHIRVDSGFNLLWLKMRPDTPQHYEYIRVEDVQGTVDHFLQILPWNQFFDMKGHRQIPRSAAEHIQMTGCTIACKTRFCVAPSPAQYTLSDFQMEGNAVTATEPDLSRLENGTFVPCTGSGT